MSKKTTAVCALVLVITAAAAFLCFRRPGDAPRINLNPYQALGAVAAEETSKLLGHHGEIIIVIHDPGEEGDPVLEAQLAAFQHGLKQAGKITIGALERVKMDAMTAMATGGTMPPAQFAAVRSKYPRADAFVLFLGFPMLPPGERNALKGRGTKFIVISAALPGYQELVRAGVIDLAIVPKPMTENEAAAAPKNLRDWFTQEYQIVTRDTAGLLP